MHIITIGDLHGASAWTGIIPDGYDRIVFMGDYVDSFFYTDEEILKNLQEVVSLKKTYPEKIVLLWGNHDLNYLFGNASPHRCSGFRYRMLTSLQELFHDNRTLFQAAWQAGNCLWTHAGIVQRWYTNYLENRTDPADTDLAATINRLFEAYYMPLFHVSLSRGGMDRDSGIFWADMTETILNPLIGYHQVIGHTHTHAGVIDHLKKDGITRLTYTDCLDTKTEFFELLI